MTWGELEEHRVSFGLTPQRMAGRLIGVAYNTYRNWKTRDKVPEYAAVAARRYAEFEAGRPTGMTVAEFEATAPDESFVLVKHKGQWVPAKAVRVAPDCVVYRVMRPGVGLLASGYVTGIVTGGAE